jgi:hypothetical protein
MAVSMEFSSHQPTAAYLNHTPTHWHAMAYLWMGTSRQGKTLTMEDGIHAILLIP